MLIDRARIHVKAGHGGDGSMSFRREKFVPKGGPDGGDGGRGGDVVVRAKANLTSLLAFQYNQHFKARPGANGQKQRKHGKSGTPYIIDVPLGTIIYNAQTGEEIADLTEPGEKVVVARGGRGGLGNVHFKTSTRQAPRIAELGEPGEEFWLQLEMRLIADVGLVGLPNAGKSTLLSAASAARPKIADYPFTTLEPNLGVVEIGGRGGQVFVLADVPGLIEGAAGGSGLGHEFLRHITRTKVLVHVLDVSGGLEGRDPLDDFRTINAELAEFDPSLPEKPMVVALNKIDLPESRDRLPLLHEVLREEGFTYFDIAAATGEGVLPLLHAVGAILRDLAEHEQVQEKPQDRRRYTLPETDDQAWTVTPIEDGHFVVTGGAIERLTKMTDFAQVDAGRRYQRVLEASGISAELEHLGVLPGDVVEIAGVELVWGDPTEIEIFEALKAAEPE